MGMRERIQRTENRLFQLNNWEKENLNMLVWQIILLGTFFACSLVFWACQASRMRLAPLSGCWPSFEPHFGSVYPVVELLQCQSGRALRDL